MSGLVSPDGRWYWDGAVWQPRSPQAGRDPLAIAALTVGILSVLLIWPFGLLLGPTAVGLGWTARRRILKSQGVLKGGGFAIAGMSLGGVVCGLYLSALLVEVAAIVFTGQALPAY